MSLTGYTSITVLNTNSKITNYICSELVLRSVHWVIIAAKSSQWGNVKWICAHPVQSVFAALYLLCIWLYYIT